KGGEHTRGRDRGGACGGPGVLGSKVFGQITLFPVTGLGLGGFLGIEEGHRGQGARTGQEQQRRSTRPDQRAPPPTRPRRCATRVCGGFGKGRRRSEERRVGKVGG